jgi:uncharacterized membrane protein YjjP (DUF1212 family)
MDYDKLIDMGTELGCQLMSSGAEIYRVEESVSRLLTAYGLAPQVFAIPNCLIVSVTTPEGHPITRMCRIPAHGTDIELLERCNALCRRLCREIPPLDEAYRQIGELRSTSKTFPPHIVVLGYILTSGFFALFFHGTLRDGLGAALCGLAVGWCLVYGQRFTGTNSFFRTAVCSAVLSTLALVLVRIGLGEHLEIITIGSLMVLVPGMALTYAMREIMAGDIFSGLHRTAEVILVATAIALGTAVPLMLGRLW